MKTHECSQGWRRYWTSSFLLLAFIVVVVVLRLVFILQDKSKDLETHIKKEITVHLNDEIVLDGKITDDVLHIYINEEYMQTINIDTLRSDTLLITDTTTNTRNEKLYK